jgi:8-oxo-dGTP pyrophosphatase MutT (NUDIX family)
MPVARRTGVRQEIASLLNHWQSASPPKHEATAAVLILLREGEGDVETLLIERAIHPEDPASGQVGLPGGHVEQGDPTLEATALRELEEEVGVKASDLSISPRYVRVQPAPIFRLRVAVFAAALRPDGSSPDPRNPAEVANVFWLPRREVQQLQRVERETPMGVIHVDAIVHDAHVIWGFTLRVLQHFFDS